VAIARKFQVESLRLACVEFMEADVTVETACQMFEEGRKLLNEPQFGLKFIAEHAADVVETPGFLALSRDCVVTLLRSSDLEVNEADLFRALDSWAANQCQRQSLSLDAQNKRKVLGDALDLIRFPDMSMEEVCTLIQSANLLTPVELLSLFTYVGASRENKPSIKYITTPRKGRGMFKNSTLLDNQQQQELSNFYNSNRRTRWRLIFKGQKDGLTGTAFHGKCDGVSPTITIIRAASSKFVFGGFTSSSWASGNGDYVPDPTAFLFSMVNALKRPCKFIQGDSQYSICPQAGAGPCFGGGHNIYIAEQMSSNENYCALHASYRPEDMRIPYTQEFFAGTYNFVVEDIEVFTLAKD